MKPSGWLPTGGSRWLHDSGRVIGNCLMRVGFRVRLAGLEQVPSNTPLVVIANHSSLIEPRLIFAMFPRRCVFLAKSELFVGPRGWFLRKLGHIPVRRGQPERTPLLTAVEVLRAGGVVGVFPEGRRGVGDVASAERGAAWLVRVTGASVLPIAVRGTRRPDGARWRPRPRVNLLAGPPFTVEVDKGRSGLDMATERLRGELAALVRQLGEWRERRAGHAVPVGQE